MLSERLAPLLVGRRLGFPGARPTATATAESALDALTAVDEQPMAKAALEMAVLDAGCRADAISLAAHLGATRRTVPAGAAVGLGSIGSIAERVAALARDGFGRVKLKIEPGHDLLAVASVREACPSMEVQVDANGSYGPGDLGVLTELAAAGVTAIEQPFPVDDVDSAAALVTAVSVPVIADEGAPSAAEASRLAALGALSGVSIKPPRLGGIGAALDVLDRCVDAGLAATAGGMVEGGLGRHALAAVAAVDGFDLTGDVSPAGRWLAANPWPDLTLTAAGITVPDTPGVAPDPDLDELAAQTIRYQEIVPT
jgi:O-succinylbenzoate synthase